MTPHHLSAIIIMVLCASPIGAILAQEPAAVQATLTLPLWPKEQMPGHGPKGLERELPARGDQVVRITDIHEPSLAVFKVPGANRPSPAIIICPGGAYSILAYNKEGTEIAAWLNAIGITGVVLKYRVPGNQDGAFQDIQRAMRLVRHQAAAWNIATDRIGVMGFSAGGHLCARLSTHAEQATYPRLDAADDNAIRPDFAILVYPAYLSQTPGSVAKGLPVSGRTPPTFLVHAEDDKAFIAGSRVYHAALEAAQVRSGFFFCAEGGHGHGLRSTKEVRVWPDRCREWLTTIGMLNP